MRQHFACWLSPAELDDAAVGDDGKHGRRSVYLRQLHDLRERLLDGTFGRLVQDDVERGASFDRCLDEPRDGDLVSSKAPRDVSEHTGPVVDFEMDVER